MMTDRLQLPIELLRVALGICPGLSREFSDEEWNDCFDFADKQAILGVIYHGIEKLSPEQKPGDIDLLMEWIGQVEYLKSRNKQVDDVAIHEIARANSAGLNCILLKGQGLNLIYKDYGMVRTPGDVDLWMLASKERIDEYCHGIEGYDEDKEGDLHTSYMVGDIPVEVHYMATYLTRPKSQKKLQEWLMASLPSLPTKSDIDNIGVCAGVGRGPFPTPTLEFNLVYLLLHMYRHYLFEGIGLRHVIDYVLVLKESTAEQRKVAYETLKSFGADKFAGALMWVIGTLFCAEVKSEKLKVKNTFRSWLLCEPDSWRGGMLMEAIIEGGNFGKANKMNSMEYRQWGVKRIWRFVSRMSKLLIAYPDEIGWHVLGKLKIKNS